MGGSRRHSRQDDPANLLILHRKCHQWAHAHPRQARELGWIVSRWADPAAVKVIRQKTT